MHEVERFLKGFERFRQRYFEAEPERFDALKNGQRPSTLLIGCSDSRVDPALLLGCSPGELFTVRIVGNLVPPYREAPGVVLGVSASIQFAVQELAVSRIIVMGHAGCGGIRALLARPPDAPLRAGDSIGPWVRIAEPARREVDMALPDATPLQRQCACEQAAILVSLRNLETFPYIQQAVTEERLTLHGWYFDLQSGTLHAYSPRADAFLPMVGPLPATASAGPA